ncbi:HPr kinase/phosphorylase [Pseudogemmobacter sp. W21_MBD1_M6]|uniref:HPr kinase/phosphorylase n=1 Tax=Pseudogemmobacter sp. W21_MBD1_M6 TaxID=3240271 RepID=UPI003F94773E
MTHRSDHAASPEDGTDNGPRTLHATTVCFAGQGLLILGAAGSGKSSLALQLLAYGADLVSDDRTIVTDREGVVFATAPTALRGKIEARGIGILAVKPAPACPVVLVVDMDQTEEARLPPEREITILTHRIPLLYKAENAAFSAAVLQFLRGGRCV